MGFSPGIKGKLTPKENKNLLFSSSVITKRDCKWLIFSSGNIFSSITLSVG
jgi:hypothetical protein